MMDESPITSDWSEAKLVATAVDDQEWLAIKEESLFSNESFFVRKYNDLSDEDKQEKSPLKADDKEHEGVCTHYIYYQSFFFSFHRIFLINY